MKAQHLVVVICGMLAGALAAEKLSAEEKANPEQGHFYVSPGLLHYDAPSVDRHGHDGFSGFGMALGYGLTDNWSVELMLGRGDSDWSNDDFGSGEDRIEVKMLNGLYKLNVGGELWQPYLTFGMGRSEFGFNGARSDSTDHHFNVGVGMFRKLTERVSIRADLRGLSHGNDNGLEPAAFIGLTGFFGNNAPPPPPPDSDGDGVPNSADQCPTTPPGRVVDERGCQIDSDGDGIVDFEDRCPGTPAGAAVDRTGCPLDSDRDGVADYLDQCPDSDARAKVDAVGCYIELEEAVTIDMNLEFETNEADLVGSHRAEIAGVVQFLREYPTANAVIEGHTDSDGSAQYNQQLSERRAKAVYDYLIGEAGIDAARLSWRGLGESQPVAPNDSAAGKQKNRRVSAVVTGSKTVRQSRDE